MRDRSTNIIQEGGTFIKLDGSPFEPHTAIFPILKHDSKRDIVQLVGTGFFITMLGHFVTAKHVIFDAIDEKTGRQNAPLHILHFVESTEYLVRHITHAAWHARSDIAVGTVDYHLVDSTGQYLQNTIPTLTTDIPPSGSPVCTFAYPESDATFNRFSAGTFRPGCYYGIYSAHSPVPRDRLLVNWPHHVTTINLLGGSSGGPVFDHLGRVIGVNCVGGLDGISYFARSTELLEVDVLAFPPPFGPGNVLDLHRKGQIMFDPPQ